MDCPYFGQQMYPGDTHLEMLVMNAISGADRLNRFGMGVFDYARLDDGMVPMNFPSRNVQDSATYSMCWAMMFGDFECQGARRPLKPGLNELSDPGLTNITGCQHSPESALTGRD